MQTTASTMACQKLAAGGAAVDDAYNRRHHCLLPKWLLHNKPQSARLSVAAASRVP